MPYIQFILCLVTFKIPDNGSFKEQTDDFNCSAFRKNDKGNCTDLKNSCSQSSELGGALFITFNTWEANIRTLHTPCYQA